MASVSHFDFLFNQFFYFIFPISARPRTYQHSHQTWTPLKVSVWQSCWIIDFEQIPCQISPHQIWTPVPITTKYYHIWLKLVKQKKRSVNRCELLCMLVSKTTFSWKTMTFEHLKESKQWTQVHIILAPGFAHLVSVDNNILTECRIISMANSILSSPSALVALFNI
jgi:hypothetical protein